MEVSIIDIEYVTKEIVVDLEYPICIKWEIDFHKSFYYYDKERTVYVDSSSSEFTVEVDNNEPIICISEHKMVHAALSPNEKYWSISSLEEMNEEIERRVSLWK